MATSPHPGGYPLFLTQTVTISNPAPIRKTAKIGDIFPAALNIYKTGPDTFAHTITNTTFSVFTWKKAFNITLIQRINLSNLATQVLNFTNVNIVYTVNVIIEYVPINPII